MKFLVLLLLVSSVSFAQIPDSTTPPLPAENAEPVQVMEKPEVSPIEKVIDEAQPVVKEEPKPVVEEIEKGALTSRENRAASKGTVMLGYQFLTTWIPSKWTAGYTHIFNEDWSLDLEYSSASINTKYIGVDLGVIRENRIALQARKYAGNSFHFSFGPVLSEFEARLGSDMVATDYSQSFSAQNLGLTGGIGNRWQWSNGVTFGIDWLRVNVPVLETSVKDNVLKDVSSSGDRKDIKDTIRTFNSLPTFVLFGLNIGYTF
jgi:hypothetical protein